MNSSLYPRLTDEKLFSGGKALSLAWELRFGWRALVRNHTITPPPASPRKPSIQQVQRKLRIVRIEGPAPLTETALHQTPGEIGDGHRRQFRIDRPDFASRNRGSEDLCELRFPVFHEAKEFAVQR